MLRDLVQPIGKTALAAPPLYLLKAILQCLRYGFGFCFAGQGREIGSQFLSFGVSNVQCHVSLQVENFLHRYIQPEEQPFYKLSALSTLETFQDQAGQQYKRKRKDFEQKVAKGRNLEGIHIWA